MDRRGRARGKDLKSVQYLDMGNYGFYVWTAYGIAALAVVIEIVTVRMRWREAAFGARDGDDTA